jgi:Spy/CpxP family protein refolding chaperone
MKRITFLTSICLLAAMTASPLAAQTVNPGPRDAAELEALNARIKQVLAQANALQREKERLAAAAGNPIPRRPPSSVTVQPQITVGSPFWRNAEFAKSVGLTTDQQKRMEDVFQQNRLKLIDLNGSLAKEESVLSSLMADFRGDEESRVLSQIDRVAEVRTELEKTNARMLLGFRQVLTPEQWNTLSTAKPSPYVSK